MPHRVAIQGDIIVSAEDTREAEDLAGEAAFMIDTENITVDSVSTQAYAPNDDLPDRFVVNVNVTTDVVANSEEQAIDIADNAARRMHQHPCVEEIERGIGFARLIS